MTDYTHSTQNEAQDISSHDDFTQASESTITTPKPIQDSEQERLALARDSFSGRLLTETQFDEIVMITRILEREIFRSGSFKNKLADYCHAMSRTERIDPKRIETSIRDIFKDRVGKTMFQLCEDLKTAEDNLSQNDKAEIIKAVEEIEYKMKEGEKITFNRALSETAQEMADRFQIKDITVIKIMAESHNEAQPEGSTDFWGYGEQLDEIIYRPQIEAEKSKKSASNSGRTTRSYSKA